MPASRPRRKHAESDPPPELFAGKYRLVRMLGKGAMGEVWLAEQEQPPSSRRRVALKRLAPRPELGDVARESFFAEAEVIARLDHPNVVRLIELGDCEGSVYLALDYIDGPAVDRVLRKVGALSPRAVAYLGREMARALEAVHSLREADGRRYAVVHRDVSPSNILIARDGRVCLTDFGVARIPGLAGEQADGAMFKGKLPYMPPELARGEPFDGRADVFSLGLTLLEALLGSRVRKADTQAQLIMRVASTPIPRARELLPDLCAPLADALDAATEFRVDKRIASAGELAEALEQVLRGMGHGAEREARDELKEHVEAYIARAGSLSGAGCHASPSLPPASGPGQSSPDLLGRALSGVPGAASGDRPSGRPSAPDARRSAPSLRGSGAPRPLGAAVGSLSVQYLDFDGPEDTPPRPRALAAATTPEGELQRSRAAAEASGGAAAAQKTGRASAAGRESAPAGASSLAGVSAARGSGEIALDETPESGGLTAEQLRRKRRIFFAGLFVLGAIATIRLLVVSSC
ncbi:protein kinase domain-containing protein [Sorangium sp. So ce861]|uniref:serine/threonine-protein kinase n=1 Tax=Sorangium sp. So ce861 TaxID=3133323 RepID=UPI003F627F2D